VRPAAYLLELDILPKTSAARTRAEPAGEDASVPLRVLLSVMS
jgi:hypothetical protein